jgi:tetratricopeptide (TPR) repeat protein
MSVLLVVLALTFTQTAHGQESQVKKAAAALEQYNNGDADAIHAALAAIEKASLHKKTSPKGSVWVLKGEVLSAIALDGGIPEPEPIAEAVEAWAQAVERGAGKDAIATGLARILSAATLALRDDLEGKRISVAWSRVEAAMKARALLLQVGWSDPLLEVPLLRMGTLVASRAAQLDMGIAWFAELRALGEFDSSAAVQLAAALNGGRDLDAAMAFLGPLLEDRPLEPALLATAVELLVQAEHHDQALALLATANANKNANSAGSSLLLAKLFRDAGDETTAIAAYERALERNPTANEAWLPLAQLLINDVVRLQVSIDSGSLTRAEKRKAGTSRADNLTAATDLLERAHEAAANTPSQELLEAMVQVYEHTRSDKLDGAKQELADLTEQ